ncbi:MAG: N-acetylneuraminate synthase family protein [Candidatus Omnitrophota bacterium]
MNIGTHNLNERVLVIAEIGNNHEGDFDRACAMVRAAAEAGAGAVKFQTIIPDKLVSVADTARINQLTRFQFSYEQFQSLAELCRECDVIFLSTPFDLASVNALDRLMPAFKIASSDNNFYPLIAAVAKTGKPVLISTGLADLKQIQTTRDFIQSQWKKQGCRQELAVLHCVTSYPTAPDAANLLAVKTLRDELGVTVGYSDHTLGIDAALAAVVLGARIIEKHFTLDKNMSDFRDHQLSADPQELRLLIDKINLMECLLGDGLVDPRPCEQAVMEQVRRSIVAGEDLSAGTCLKMDDLSWVRPGGGLAPGSEDQVVGKMLVRSIGKGQKITLEDLKG